MRLGALLNLVEEYDAKADAELIRKAYEFAEKAHSGQKRASGEPFIQHPLNTAYIVAQLKLDTVSIVSALLHDTVEDTSVTLDDVKREFGGEVALIVDGVTNIKRLNVVDKETYHAESIRKVIMASARDIRVIFVKLADKLHNMRTLDCFRPEKRQRRAMEVRDVYAPIAYKLGLANIKWELEDLAMKYLQPETYETLQKKISKTSRQREEGLAKIKALVEKELEGHGIKALVSGRPKHVYSVYRKMERKQCSFEEIYDLTALRIITKTVKDCYEVIGIMHSMWRPIPKEFDDYIAMPKPNLYQSLHTAVIGPEGRPIEIQVRTEDMHATAEEGIAAHWSYKGVHGDQKFDNQLSWLKQILEWQRESKDSKEFMDMLKIDFFEDEIFSFTPKGQVIELSKGSCILDFAYAVHTGIGDKCVGGKVNGRFVPLRTLVKNGDVVEIVTTNSQKPSREWLKFVRTPKARQKIKQSLRESTDIPVGTASFVRHEKKELEQWVIETNLPNVRVKLSKCCNPLPGDSIEGYLVAGRRVSVHKVECTSYHALKQKMKKAGKKVHEVDVRWADNPNIAVEFYIEAVNRVGLFAEILNTIVTTQTAIKSAKAKMISSVLVECRFSLDSRGLAHLQDIVKRIGKVKDVKNIYLSEVEEER